MQMCTLERAFLHLLSQRLHVPVNIWRGLEARYPIFHAWLESRGTLCAPSNLDTIEIPRRRKISDAAKSYIFDSFNQSYWTDTTDWTPWAFFMIDTISSQGFLDGVLSSDQSFGLLITRFRSVWVHFLSHAFPRITENKAAKHGSAFGLRRLSAFQLHLRPRNKVALWSVLIQASLDCNFETTRERRSRSHWKPNWQLVWKEILAAYACRCLQGTEGGGKKMIRGKFWNLFGLLRVLLAGISVCIVFAWNFNFHCGDRTVHFAWHAHVLHQFGGRTIHAHLYLQHFGHDICSILELQSAILDTALELQPSKLDGKCKVRQFSILT